MDFDSGWLDRYAHDVAYDVSTGHLIAVIIFYINSYA